MTEYRKADRWIRATDATPTPRRVDHDRQMRRALTVMVATNVALVIVLLMVTVELMTR